MDNKIKFGIKSIFNGHDQIKYRGIQAAKCPFDYVIYQMIISELMPDLIIEIGTNIGGGALYLADLLNNIGHGIVHTIDIKKQSDERLWHNPRIKIYTEGWEGYDLTNANNYSKILVIDDASHIYKNTLDAMLKFAPIVSTGSYLIVEDGIINELGKENIYNGGPLKAIKEFMKINNDFIIDRYWCDLFGVNATFNVNGYLKKMK